MKIKILEIYEYYTYDGYYDESDYLANNVQDTTDWIEVDEDELKLMINYLRYEMKNSKLNNTVRLRYVIIKHGTVAEQLDLLTKIREGIKQKEEERIQAEIKKKERAEKRAQKNSKIIELKKQIKQLEKEQNNV